MEFMDQPPTPAIALEDAQAIVEEIKKAGMIKRRSHKVWVYDNCFVGEDLVDLLIKSNRAKDAESALPIGQALLDHRLAHHVNDDMAFKNEYALYRLYADESESTRKEAALFEERVAKAKLAGYLKLRSLKMFSSPTFFDCYCLLCVDEEGKKAVIPTIAENVPSASSAAASPTRRTPPPLKKQPSLVASILGALNLTTTAPNETRLKPSEETEVKKFPGVLYVYKLRSAPVPALKLQIQDCACSMTECVNCLTGAYCFTVSTNEVDSKRVQDYTLCAKNSKQMEAWMFAFQASGISFDKVDEGIVKAESVFELSGNDLMTNELVPLSKYKGKVVIVTNVASHCGLTKRDYTEFVELHKKYRHRGFEVLAFPTGQFAQEFPTAEEIRKFVDQFGVEFPMFAKIKVNGSDAHPVFKYLKQNLGGVLGSSIKWNFTKFLCDRDGKPVRRYSPTTPPTSFVEDIEALLGPE